MSSFAPLLVVLLLITTTIHRCKAEPYFTNETITQVTTNLTKSNMLMTVLNLNYNIPSGISSDSLANFNRYSTVYIVQYESLLYVKPYTRYYTAITITKNFYFTQLAVSSNKSEEITNTILNPNTTKSPFLKEIINELNLTESLPDYLVCAKSSRSLAGQSYYCLDTAGEVSQDINPTPLVVYIDVTYYFFQILATSAIVYFFIYSLRLIRKGKKFIYVTDSTRNPPFWQFTLLSFLKTPQLVNFRLWDTVQIILLQIIISILSIFSQYVPETWPDKNWPKDSLSNLFYKNYQDRKTFFYVVVGIIVLNWILLLLKLLTDYKHYRRVKVHMEPTLLNKFIRLVISVVCGMFCSSIMVVYLITVLSQDADFRLIIWYCFAILFCFILIVHLFVKNIYVDRYLMETLQKGKSTSSDSDLYYEMENIVDGVNVEEYVKHGLNKHKARMTRFAAIITFFMCAQEGLWLATQGINTFTAMFVVIKFIESTVSNCLLNNDFVTTYSYILSVLLLVYKFFQDICDPYTQLKNMIARERNGLSWDRILGYRAYMRTVSMNDIMSDMKLRMDLVYVIPLTWTVFVRVAKLMRIYRVAFWVVVKFSFGMFVLGLFFMASFSLDNGSFFSKTTSALVVIAAGALIPIIPKLLTFFEGSTLDSEVFKVRLLNALRLLERQEEFRNKVSFNHGPIPTKYAPFRYMLVSNLRESRGEKMDIQCDYDPVTYMPVPVNNT